MAEARPNILLIVVDSLRVDFMGPRKSGESLTPRLDRFAARSTLFTQAITQGSSTPPAVKALLSSTYAYEHDGPTSRLSLDRPYLPAMLSESGYTTGGIVTNLYLESGRGWARGFSEYDDCSTSKVYKSKLLFRGINQAARRMGRPLQWPVSLPAEELVQRAERWIQKAHRPFFLWIQTMDTHWPYRLQRFSLNPSWQKNQTFDRRVIRPRLISATPSFTPEEHAVLLDQYTRAVRYTDQVLGAFLEKLEQSGLLENTVVALTADHGEEFGEHGRYFHSAHLYDELVHVPLVLRLPHSEKTWPARWEQQVRLIDLAPTFLDLAGQNGNMRAGLRGESLLPLLNGQAAGERMALIQAFTGQDYALRWKGWKYLFNQETGLQELYRLDQDPGESHNCLEAYPETAQEFRAALEPHIHTRQNQDRLEDEDAEFITRLRDLGYV